MIGYDGEIISKGKQESIAKGLITIIKNCRVEDNSDEDAIDYHYLACRKLYRLARERAESLIVNELVKCTNNLESMRLIEALGVLVGTEYQGFLLESTVIFLKNILINSNSPEMQLFARSVLQEDIARVNKEKPFLNEPLVVP